MEVHGMVLCAGLGTRLRPLSLQLPKALAVVGDRPLAGHAVQQLLASGIRHISFNAYHLASAVQAFVQSLSAPGVSFRCCVEAHLLGTAGGVRRLAADHRGPALVWNGDIYAPDLDVADVLSNCPSVGPMLVVAPCVGGDTRGRGTLGLNEAGQVVRLRNRQFGREVSGANFIGLCVLPSALIGALPEEGCLVGDGLVPWLARGNTVATYSYLGHWSDGGTLPEYLQQNWLWLRSTRRETYIAPSAVCSPQVHARQVVAGEGATIGGQGELRRVVVCPRAQAVAPLRDAVVLPDGTVVEVPVAHGVASVC